MTKYLLFALVLMFSLGYFNGATAQPVQVYCQNTFGTVMVFSGTCPMGWTLVGIKD